MGRAGPPRRAGTRAGQPRASSAAGTPVHFFGLTLPALVGEDEDLADTLQSLHVDAAWALLALVTLHLAAALWHHFVLRDHTLRMMLPRRHR